MTPHVTHHQRTPQPPRSRRAAAGPRPPAPRPRPSRPRSPYEPSAVRPGADPVRHAVARRAPAERHPRSRLDAKRARCRAASSRSRSRATTSSPAPKPAPARPPRSSSRSCSASCTERARRDRRGTRALVLAPTRELAVQIEDQVQGLTYHTAISSIAVYGGVPMDIQERALRAGVDIVVATPGRLMDHMRHDSVELHRARGAGARRSGPDARHGLLARRAAHPRRRCPPMRQTLLFSATMPGEVLKLTQEFLREPKLVQVGRRGGPAQTISHAVQTVPASEKTQWLAQLAARRGDGPGARVLPDEDRRRSAGDAA